MDRNCSRSQIFLLHNSSAILAQNLLLILLPCWYDEALDYAPRGLSDTPSFPDAANRAGFGMGQACDQSRAATARRPGRPEPVANLRDSACRSNPPEAPCPARRVASAHH